MKNLLLTFIFCLFAACEINAVPAYHKPVTFTMPDGKTITIIGHGDEYNSHITTIDGYTVVSGDDDYFYYAKLVNGELTATNVVAHNADMRSSAEIAFLANQQKNLRATVENTSIKRLAPMKSERVAGKEYTNDVPYLDKVVSAKQNYRGLVILVNYNDCKFRLGESANALYTDLMSARNYTGYTDELDGKFKECTGSVRDYFYENSHGMFDPEFDVYGPYDINKSMYDMKKTSASNEIAKLVLTAADNDIDFTQYDSDGDGEVDMFYIIYAGYASSYDGNNSNLLWPHATYMYGGAAGYKKDGIRLGRYACSTELFGWTRYNDKELNGIGTICHEFSHVLGYADHYDVNYGGHEYPEEWDVMAGGNYGGVCGRTPVGYNAYEMISGGFIAPTLITSAHVDKVQTLNPLNQSPECFRLNTRTQKEYFLLENRQQTRWDSSLPGHGMLIWRVDSTDANLWRNHQVNSTDHLCFQLIRANGYAGEGRTSGADAFPGTKSVTSITNKTKVNLINYRGFESPFVLKKIRENDGIINFTVVDPYAQRVLPEGAIFYESFNDCEGTGGNDDNFNNGSANATFEPDYDGWTVYKAFGGDQCARFGNMSSPKGYATTPEITLESDKTYELSFRAAPYYTQPQDLKVEVTSGDAQLSISGGAPATSVSVVTKTREWSDFTVNLVGSGEVKLKFSGNTSKNYTFFLDEVLVKDVTTSAINTVKVVPADNAPCYNLNGQRVGKNAKGIIISNGKKVIR